MSLVSLAASSSLLVLFLNFLRAHDPALPRCRQISFSSSLSPVLAAPASQTRVCLFVEPDGFFLIFLSPVPLLVPPCHDHSYTDDSQPTSFPPPSDGYTYRPATGSAMPSHTGTERAPGAPGGILGPDFGWAAAERATTTARADFAANRGESAARRDAYASHTAPAPAPAPVSYDSRAVHNAYTTATQAAPTSASYESTTAMRGNAYAPASQGAPTPTPYESTGVRNAYTAATQAAPTPTSYESAAMRGNGYAAVAQAAPTPTSYDELDRVRLRLRDLQTQSTTKVSLPENTCGIWNTVRRLEEVA